MPGAAHYHTFTADEVWSPFVDGSEKTVSNEYGLSFTGTFGSGTLTVEYYDASAAAWQFLGSATAQAAYAVKCGIGKKLRFSLAGSTSPSLKVSYWPV